MNLLLAADLLDRLDRELRLGGTREVGGLLMAEHVDDETFRTA